MNWMCPVLLPIESRAGEIMIEGTRGDFVAQNGLDSRPAHLHFLAFRVGGEIDRACGHFGLENRADRSMLACAVLNSDPRILRIDNAFGDQGSGPQDPADVFCAETLVEYRDRAPTTRNATRSCGSSSMSRGHTGCISSRRKKSTGLPETS